MIEKILKNNQAVVIGEIASEFKFSHEVFKEGFYMVDVLVGRLSETMDRIPVMISERLIDVKQNYIGQKLEIVGQFRSYNKHENGHNKLILSLFAREVNFVDNDNPMAKPNSIFLDGYICKQPVYRTTPLGREIADILLAVNRAYGKSDYIPCICWGRNARFVSRLEVGSHVQIWGRIQSRQYQKKLPDDTVTTCVAYEISVSKIEYEAEAVAAAEEEKPLRESNLETFKEQKLEEPKVEQSENE